MPAASIWFEIWGLWIRVKNQFFLANFEKFRFFSGNFIKKFRFSRQNWPFTAASGQIILFFFKSHHFRTYFLYMIRYNNISRPPTTPLRPPPPLPKIWGSRPPTHPGLTPLLHALSLNGCKVKADSRIMLSSNKQTNFSPPVLNFAEQNRSRKDDCPLCV